LELRDPGVSWALRGLTVHRELKVQPDHRVREEQGTFLSVNIREVKAKEANTE